MDTDRQLKSSSTTQEEISHDEMMRTLTKTDDTTAFLRAARSGNLEKVIEYLETDLDINTANSNGLNALHLASRDGHVEIVTELLKRGAKVDANTKKGNTALHIASLAGQAEIVNILIQYGASINIQSQNGFTPLYMAAQENHDRVVQLLLSNGANQSLATEDGFTPLAVAMQQGHDKVVSVLFENDSMGKVRLPALHIAAKKDDCEAADLLLQNDHKPDVTSKSSGFTPLHIASHYGNEEIARLLIKRGADVNYLAKHNISPLHVAAKWGKNNMVKILLDNSATIDAKTRDGLTPLHCAARSGHEEVVSTLLEYEAPISARTKNGLAPLHMASQGDHVDAARVLLYHRAPVDEVTIDYLTSLHVAAHCGHVRVAKLLLDRKADPNARALNGYTPLHIACKKNRIKVVELLLKHGASIESTTESGLTPLHVASFMGCMNIVIFLLQHEANPDVPTVRGETPLHLAARANQTDIIRILLRNGAKVDARAREEQTPLHIASRLGNVDIVMLLLQHGAAVDTTTKDMYTALHIAAKEGQEEVAAILVENHASVKAATKNGFTPLHIAAKYGNMNVAKILLQKDSKLDAQGKNDITPLHLACHYDHSNVANMILEKGAPPHLSSQNGHTPLHIAARKNQMDIASTLLEHGADPNVESKAGFTPLQLSAQKGHYDMTNLLIEHGADPNHRAKNGLTALHLCAQEDFIRVASILVKNGANVESETETGYRPIHVAAHFGNLSMIRFLLKHNAQIDVRTDQNYTPLHQAAQQGHAHIVSALLEANASHNARTNDGLTALNVAQKLGYISVMEVLKGLSYDTLTPDNRTWEEKYKVIAPESLQETSFMSDSDDEGGSDGLINEQPYRYLTADLMKSLRDDSLPIDVTRDDPMHHQVSKEEKLEFVQSNNYCLGENFDSNDSASFARLHFRSFLVSFLVDARGGAMKGCRHSGIRIIVPPRRATMPIRVTCRLIKPSKVANPPSLMEGEALSTRIIEMGPVGASFLGPVLIDVPHFASVQGKEREIIILRSENGETWKEHDNSSDNDDTLFNTPHGSKRFTNTQMSASHSGRITRILTTEFPQYFAIVTRIKQEVHVIGADGGILVSSVANHVQAVFPPGALTKKIKVGLQAHVIPAELTAKLLGNCVAVSPVITIEPRRRKFHKPITLTIPVPQAANKGMINQYGGETPTLRLLCSIAGGTSEAQWEDVTGSTPLTFMNERVSFTTTVSARFWLMDCRNISEVPKMATELYKESLFVPFVTNFIIYTKKMDLIEATLRILCMTDGKEGIRTLERQEEFLEIVKSRDVEALDGKDLYIEFSGNLVPVTKSGVQLKFTFKAFRQNRLSFHVKVRDPLLDPVARMMFMRDPKVAKGDPSQQPICVLNIVLPESTVTGESEKKIKDYQDSNITERKYHPFESSYMKEDEGEKGDKPKPSSPLESKFITDVLQRKQKDAATIHESFAQKAACPLESVDASYPSNVSAAQDEMSPINEKQTYTEKRKFWEDIARKRESYQRSESEMSRTSQLTINESDSECCVQNIVSEEETAEALPPRSETLEDINIPDISECSVAEKAHYFEEQIQKELSTSSRPTSKYMTQESSIFIKEQPRSLEMSREKSESQTIETIDGDIDEKDAPKVVEWDFSESAKEENASEALSKLESLVEARESKTEIAQAKIETREAELVEEIVQVSIDEKELPREAQSAKKKSEKTKIPSKISAGHAKVCKEFLHREAEFARAELESSPTGKTCVTDENRDFLQAERGEADIGLATAEEATKARKEELSVSLTAGSSMIPRKISPEVSAKFETMRANEKRNKQEPSTVELGKQDDISPGDKESTSPSEKVALKMQEEAANTKTRRESRIPVFGTKTEKIVEPPKHIDQGTRSKITISPVSDESPTSPMSKHSESSTEDAAKSPKKEFEFESRIPKRSDLPKAAANFTTETKRTEKFSEVKTKISSKSFVGQSKDAAMNFEEAQTETSKVDRKESTKETKEISKLDKITAKGAEKLIEHTESERTRKEKLSESIVTKATPRQIIRDTSVESRKLDSSVAQEISQSFKDGKETVKATASQLSKFEESAKKLQSLVDDDVIFLKSTDTRSVEESQSRVALNIESLGDEINRAAAVIEEREPKLAEQSSISKVNIVPPAPMPMTGTKMKGEEEEGEEKSLEEKQATKVEARNIAETIVDSIESEIAKRSASIEGLDGERAIDASDSDSKEYSDNVLDSLDTKESQVLHDRMADDLTKKFQDIMERRSSRSHSQVLDENDTLLLLLPERLRCAVVSHDENLDKASNRGSTSISEDFTRDEESTPHDKEASLPSSTSQTRLMDRDITLSPSSISDQIDLEIEIESERSALVEPVKGDTDKGSSNVKLFSFPPGAGENEETLEREFEYRESARQDSIDVPSLEMDDPTIFRQQQRHSKEFSSIHESPAVDSLERIGRERDTTTSPSTLSDDTNIDLYESPRHGAKDKIANLTVKSIDNETIESPSVLSPRLNLRLNQLEIKPVNWMIGDEKIQVSETLEPSQAFDKELEAYHSALTRQRSETFSRDGSADFEQESGTRSSEELSTMDTVRDTGIVVDGGHASSSAKSCQFTVVPVVPTAEPDFDSELVENRLDVSCQELVDTLQREYEAKTPTDDPQVQASRYTFETDTAPPISTKITSRGSTDFSVHTQPLDSFIEAPILAVTSSQLDTSAKISGEPKIDVSFEGSTTASSPAKRQPLEEATSDSSAFSKLKREDLPSVDLSARYAITVLDQAVKKEIDEVKESLEAAKQDLIEELGENSEKVSQIKDSPSEFQFKLEPETIPNELPFLYKAPASLEQSLDQDTRSSTIQGSPPIAKPRRHDSKDLPEEDESQNDKYNIQLIESTNELQANKTTIEESSQVPIAASRSSSDVTEKDEAVGSALLAPQPAPRRRPKPARTSRKVTSESDAGSSSGDSSNYQSCDYESYASRPSSSDIEALQSTLPSGTASEYETAPMSIENSSASKPTSLDYQSAVSTLSSRESMKSLNSLSSGHLGSIDSTGELSETLVASDAEEEDEEEEEEEDDDEENPRANESNSSGSEIRRMEDDSLPCRMKRSSEMIFQQIVDEAATEEQRVEQHEETEEGDIFEEETRFDECTTEQLPSDTLAEDEEAFKTDSIFMSTDLTSEAYDKTFSSIESKTDVPEVQIDGSIDARNDAPGLDIHPEAEDEIDLSESKEAGETTSVDETAVIETMQSLIGTLLHQASTTSSTSGAMSFETVIEKDSKIDRHSPDSDSFELVDKPDIMDDFVVIEEVGREAEEYDSEGKSISIGAISYTSMKKYDRDLENLMTEKEEKEVSTSGEAGPVLARNNDLFEFESEESPPQASNDDQYSQSLSDDENFEGSKKWMEMQFQNDPRAYDMDYDRGRLEDIKEEEITDFEAGSSRFGSLGSHKGSIGSVGSMRGSYGSTTEFDVLAGKKCFSSKPMEHDNVSLSSLQEFEHLESTLAMENSKKLQCGSQESVNNGSLPRRYMASRSGHGDDVSLSSLKDFEGLEKACREAHLIELRAREEEDLLDHESPENRYKLENLPRPKPTEPVSAAGSFNPSTSGSDDYEKRVMEIDEIIRIAQANVEKFDRQDDTTEDISQIEITADAELLKIEAPPARFDSSAVGMARVRPDSNIMETSTDSLEFEDNADKMHNPLCRSSDSLEMKTTIDFPSLSSDSLNNVLTRDSREAHVETIADQFNTARRISSDSLEMPLLEQTAEPHSSQSHDRSSSPSYGSCHIHKGSSLDDSIRQSSTDTKLLTNNGKTRSSPSTSDT